MHDCFVSFLKGMQTKVTYETRKLTDMEFPVYFSLFATPGYNMPVLDSLGFSSQYSFFWGKNNITYLYWGNETLTIQGI